MTETNSGPPPEGKGQRSGAIGALLSLVFPGLGQAYLRRRRAAVVFAAPVIVVLAGLVTMFAGRGAFRLLDPTVSLVVLLTVVALGGWWSAAVFHAWLSGRHTGAVALATISALVLVIVGADAFGAAQLLRLRNAAQQMFTPVSFEEPSPAPSATAVAALATAAPVTATSPSPRPTGTLTPSGDPSPPLPSPTPVPSEEPEPEPTIVPGPPPEFDIKQIDASGDGLLNVLLVGFDWEPGRESRRTDSMVVVSANSQTGEVLMFSFPRDTAYFKLYTGGMYAGKLNTFAGFAARDPGTHPEGGMQALAYQVGFLLGTPIDYYATINMPGFHSVIELVGGVTVNNTRVIQDNLMQFYLEPGVHRLNADQALLYVRTRHGSGGDFARARRQQEVLAALRQEMVKPENLARLPEIIEALSKVINTDFPPSQIDQLLILADQLEAETSRSWVFGYPNWATLYSRTETGTYPMQVLRIRDVATLSVEVFGERSLYANKRLPKPYVIPTPMPTPTGTPSPAATPTPKPEPSPEPARSDPPDPGPTQRPKDDKADD